MASSKLTSADLQALNELLDKNPAIRGVNKITVSLSKRKNKNLNQLNLQLDNHPTLSHLLVNDFDGENDVIDLCRAPDGRWVKCP